MRKIKNLKELKIQDLKVDMLVLVLCYSKPLMEDHYYELGVIKEIKEKSNFFTVHLLTMCFDRYFNSLLNAKGEIKDYNEKPEVKEYLERVKLVYKDSLNFLPIQKGMGGFISVYTLPKEFFLKFFELKRKQLKEEKKKIVDVFTKEIEQITTQTTHLIYFEKELSKI